MIDRRKARLAVDCRNHHGEGVLWSAEHGLVMWTDIEGRRVWTLDPASGESRSFATASRVCCLAPREGRPFNEIVAALAEGFAFCDLLTGECRPIRSIEAELSNTRLNDGRTDRRGRLVAGGLDESGGKGPASAVYRLDGDAGVTRLFGDVGCANGIAFSPDGTRMWFADSYRGDIEIFDYDPATGTVDGRRQVARVAAPGVPDGACVDAEGCLWTAVWDGHRVERRTPEGDVVQVIEVPARKPTCCAFGGARLDTLFITSSRYGESEADLLREPEAGGLFAVEPGVVGLADTPFAG